MLINLEAADRFERAVGFGLQRHMRTIFEKFMEKDVWQEQSGLHALLHKEMTELDGIKSLDAVLSEETNRPLKEGTVTHLAAADLRPFWRRLLPLIRLRTDMLSLQLRIGNQRVSKVHFFRSTCGIDLLTKEN